MAFAFLVTFECQAEVKAGGLIAACSINQARSIDEAYAVGVCMGLVEGMLSERSKGCGGGLPGYSAKGVRVALSIAKRNLESRGDWWPNNPPSYLLEEAFKLLRTKRNYAGKECPADDYYGILFNDL